MDFKTIGKFQFRALAPNGHWARNYWHGVDTNNLFYCAHHNRFDLTNFSNATAHSGIFAQHGENESLKQ